MRRECGWEKLQKKVDSSGVGWDWRGDLWLRRLKVEVLTNTGCLPSGYGCIHRGNGSTNGYTWVFTGVQMGARAYVENKSWVGTT